MFFYYHSEFCSMVERIYIYSYEEAKRLTPKAKLPDVVHTTKANPNKLSPESDMPQSDLDSNTPAADKD
jgi:auxin response factor